MSQGTPDVALQRTRHVTTPASGLGFSSVTLEIRLTVIATCNSSTARRMMPWLRERVGGQNDTGRRR